MNNKLKILALAVVVGLLLLWIFKANILKPEAQKDQSNKADTSNTQDESPKIVSTKPDPLMDGIVAATDPIEITFNRPLQNTGEFKVKMEPKIDFKITLSPDRKTGIVTFTKPLDLGTSFTLSIGPDTKFDGAGEWGQNKDFHFRTVQYNGV